MKVLIGFFTACLIFPFGSAWANTLQDVSFTELPGNSTRITLTFSDPVAEPSSFVLDNPARISLDFMDARSALAKRSQTIGIGSVRSVSAVEAMGRTRVVVNMTQSEPHLLNTSGNQVTITVGDASGVADSPAPATTPSVSASSDSQSLTNVDFRRGENGEGRVIVTLADAGTVIDVHEEGGKIVLNFVGGSISDRLARRLDVVDFATPVTLIDTYAESDGVRMVITATPEFEYLSYQANDVFTVEFKKPSEDEAFASRRRGTRYTGDTLSLNFQSIEVRAVLQLLADFTGLNLVTSDTVTGSVTLRLKNVPWDQALDLILKTKGLSKRQAGNVIMVAPTEELAAREKLELESEQQIKTLAPLHAEYIQINYAKAGEIAALMKSEDNSLLSERGNVTIDNRTNTLLVQDTALQLEDIRRMVARLDIPVRQVLIESRIVVANNNFAKDLGVRLGLSGSENDGNGVTTIIGGGIPGDLDTTGLGGPIIENPGGSGNEALLVDLPSSSASSAINLIVGKLGTSLLRLELSAMQSEGRGEVISSPRIITSDQQKAVIEQGVEVGYQTVSQNGTNVQFKEAILALEVTPQITPDDRIIMDLVVKKDGVGDLIQGVPSIDTRSIETKVLVNNGDTIVLGGVYEKTTNTVRDSVPLFGDLPLVGWAFRKNVERNDSRELLVFITPKILKDGLTLQ